MNDKTKTNKNSENYTFSPEACAFKKSYGKFCMTIIIELTKDKNIDYKQQMALGVLINDVTNLLDGGQVDTPGNKSTSGALFIN